MATIFSKLPASGEQCLILNQSEALIYPFNIGAWTEMRIGAFFSFTQNTGDNSTWLNETVNYNGALNGVYWGIKDSGVSLPLTAGSTYVGLAVNSSFTNTSVVDTAGQQVEGGDGGLNFVQIFSSGISTSSKSFAGSRLYMASSVQQTGVDAFASYNGMKIEVTGAGTNGQSLRMSYSHDAAYTNNTSEANLKQKLSTFANPNLSTFNYFTSGFVGGAGPLTIPSAFFLYVPFFNNRIRIHSLVVEKYS